MFDLKVGDKLASHDGQDSEVIAIHPRGTREVFRVTFSDGRSTEACGDHLWTLYHPSWSRSSRGKGHRPNRKKYIGPKTLSTKEVQKLSNATRKIAYIDIPTALQYNHDNNNVPVDPWLLGILLGDGRLSSEGIAFTSAH